ncbi:ornithine cyclodeaminase family protein [Occallatibacter riparius]|uniref:Ornithine cyclodeaminase family protein n=1 Tax=Occallatibacter riparius TaxID=1002689 RepID=A0A9J7BNK4_9BACT|nr:ornithine cyclodeaminase family protein [Occallatibacter riparius]UWZ84307.1 ornithine cyclodeaminase family protein [Occallatibacter riparius]
MYIPEEEVRSLLTWEALFPAIRQALIDFSAGPRANHIVDQPPRSILRSNHTTGPNNGWFAAMPVIYQDVMAVKTVTFFPGNANLGLHTHMAIIELLSRTTGQPLAIMDGRLITEMRTAAVSAVALDALVPRGARSLGILGSGVQARSHLAAFRLLRPDIADVRIWSRTPAHVEAFAAGTQIRATTIEEAASADVVLVATASPTPVLMGRWLKPDALVISVGAVGPTVRELDDETLHTSYIVAESRHAAERESGDIVLSNSSVQAEIGEILSDPASHPFPKKGRVLFKSVGMAIEDLVAAKLVWQARQSR